MDRHHVGNVPLAGKMLPASFLHRRQCLCLLLAFSPVAMSSADSSMPQQVTSVRTRSARCPLPPIGMCQRLQRTQCALVFDPGLRRVVGPAAH
eukprot:6204658-Pleurochrysis_carterae.AAC.3